MNPTTVSTIINPLVKTGIFKNVEDAAQNLVEDYIYRQIICYQGIIRKMERKYGMDFARFTNYIKERAENIQSSNLSPQQKKTTSQAIMIEEDDWMDWKVAYEMLDSWLGLKNNRI
ncbi:MAG: hypothetical protein ABIF11_09300 [Nitrospirota bacterium]